MPDWKPSFSLEEDCFQSGISLHFRAFIVRYGFSPLCRNYSTTAAHTPHPSTPVGWISTWVLLWCTPTYFIILAEFSHTSPLCKEPGGGGRNADAACVNAAPPVDYLGFAVMRPDGVLLWYVPTDLVALWRLPTDSRDTLCLLCGIFVQKLFETNLNFR